jgi:hypothetical protein
MCIGSAIRPGGTAARNPGRKAQGYGQGIVFSVQFSEH